MGISYCVTGCTSNYSRRGENSPHVTVFKFPDNEDLRRKWILNIPRKLDKITTATRVCIKHFEVKDVHTFNIHTNPDGTTYKVRYNYCSYISS